MFVTFEGIDGSGKSTQIELLAERLTAAGYVVCTLREPGGTELSERIRALLLDPAMHIVPFAELLLFSAARAQLVAEEIKPALERGEVVISDRFYDSTTAYQGAGRNVAAQDWIQAFNRQVTGGLVPARTYWMDLPPDVALARRGDRPQDRMETAETAFFERIATAYQHIALTEPDRILTLDATLPRAYIHEQIWADLSERLALPKDEH